MLIFLFVGVLISILSSNLKKRTDDSKKAQRELELYRDHLLELVEQEKDKLSTLVESIPDEVWFANTEKNFTLANPAARGEFEIGKSETTPVESLA